MEEITTSNSKRERALLVGLELPSKRKWEVEDSMKELALLADTAGAEVVTEIITRRTRPTAPFFIGRGKAEELQTLAEIHDIDIVIFNNDLRPAQMRNLQKILQTKLLDRTELILDIFAKRAKTKAGKLQIELAQLEYLLPRLTRMWTHLSRQVGGIGTRGPGEKQLEVDRRRIQERISKLQRELEEVRKHRTVQRKQRKRSHFPCIALVGYTNAGKSTLFNAITSSHVFVEDKLFATLDPMTRGIGLPNRRKAFLSDTVGFIKELPHDLIEAFKATLEEVIEADMLLHIIDISHELVENRIHAVESVLKELKVHDKPTVLALNKTDLIKNPRVTRRYLAEIPNSVAISARYKTGLNALLAKLEESFNQEYLSVKLVLPVSNTKLLARLYTYGYIKERYYHDNTVVVSADLSKRHIKEWEPYVADST